MQLHHLHNAMFCRSDLARGKEAVLSRALEVVEAQLSPTSPAGLQRRLDALAAACRLRAHSGVGAHSDGESLHIWKQDSWCRYTNQE